MSEIGEILRRTREDRRWSIEGAAKSLGINKNTLGGYERGERLPDTVFLMRYAATVDVSLKKLVDALIASTAREATSEIERNVIDAFFDANGSYSYSLPEGTNAPGALPLLLRETGLASAVEVVQLSKYDCSGSCGPGSLVDNARVIDMVPFSLEWLRREGLKPEATIMIGSKGDSMAPRIPPGADLLLDRSKIDPTFGGIYAFVYQDELFVKYVQRTNEGLQVSSEQSDRNPPRLFVGEEADMIRIEGRVHVVISRT